MMRPTRGDISDKTGFDSGDLFESEQQVRDYFTAAEQRRMFPDGITDQDLLDEMAEQVIEYGWHMTERQSQS